MAKKKQKIEMSYLGANVTSTNFNALVNEAENMQIPVSVSALLNSILTDRYEKKQPKKAK